MTSYSPLGEAIVGLLKKKALSRAQLAAKAPLKQETLNDIITGKRAPRAHTRKIIAEALGITPEELARIESEAEPGESVASPEASSSGLEAMLRDVLERVSGLPLAVARSIVEEFDEDGADKTAGELEAILRRKAVEYKALRDELTRFSTDDPQVQTLRDEALASVEEGDFDKAYEHLLAARRLDRIAGQAAERIRLARRSSEAETVLSTARLAALRANYREAFELSLEAREVLDGADRDLEARILTSAANFLNTECHALGSEGVIERNIEQAERALCTAAASCSPSTYLTVLLEVADLYALLGYRRGDNRVLREATARFRKIWKAMPSDAPPELKIRTAISLGDTHAEIGLNRKSLWQARIGIGIMRRALDCPSIAVGPVERANALVRLGTAQANAGLMSQSSAEFDDSVASYEAAMELVGDLDEPLTRARAWWGLSIAFLGRGKSHRSTAILQKAEACCDEALKVLTRARYPIDWATNITNRGNAKLERGMIENDTASLSSAIVDYEQALQIRTKGRFPLGYAKTLGNMATAKRVMAERLGDRALATDALADIGEALSALVGGTEDYWRSYYGAEQEKIEALIARMENGA